MADEDDDLTLEQSDDSPEVEDNASELSEASPEPEPVKASPVFNKRSASTTIKVGS
jgi:hypothetical protein